MGNFSTKDNHGPTGSHLETFHTPPSSPQNDAPCLAPSVPHFPPSTAAPAPPLSPSPGITISWKKSPQSTSTSISPPDWSPPPPVIPNTSKVVPAVSLVHKKTGSAVAGRADASLGKNGGPPASSTRTLVSQVKSVAVSPVKSPSPACSESPASSSLEQNCRERDKGPSQSLLHGNENIQSEELVELLGECRTTLGISANQDGTTNTPEILKHLLTEVKSLKTTLQTERGEWLQFQADLQVAVSVADRLRAEAEEELTALRSAHKDMERELAAAHQRQKEAEMQLVTLQGELKETRQRLATLTETKDKTKTHVLCQEPERPSGESKNSDSTEGCNRSRGRGLYRVGGEGVESKNQTEVMKSPVDEDAKTNCKGVTQRYLRNVKIEDGNKGDVQFNETRRTLTTERSRSLSRLPASSDSLTLQNGTSQSTSASTLGPNKKNLGQLKGRRGVDWQEGRSSSDAGKREESLNKYNSALSEMPPTRSQDGFNLLLRRHGGSKRNSLLRWCQSRTQGYKNIDITNFSSSWVDGLAFCAVYHTYLPSHIPYSTLTLDNKKENLSLAFKTGESVGISPSLTVDEMLRVGGPDWQRVLNYVESIYRHFEM